MFGKSKAWSASGETCDICGKPGEMQIDCVDKEGLGSSAVFCLECLNLIVAQDFETLQEKQGE
jgi:hypothetical protein